MNIQALIILMLVGIGSGIAIGMQGPMASIITHKLGMLESVFIIHLVGALIAFVPLLFRGGGKLNQWRDLPWYVFLGGLFGLIVLAAISYLIPRIGVTSAMMLIIVGQFIIGAVLDHLGLLGAEVRQFSMTKVGGLLIMLAGAYLSIRS
jgi:transporter family-2 protein